MALKCKRKERKNLVTFIWLWITEKCQNLVNIWRKFQIP